MNGDDLPAIEAWLDGDGAIAQIVSEGEGKWRARMNVELGMPGRWHFFHIACGPLPLLMPKDSGEPDGEIADPFAGWTERRAGAEPTTPYFGPGHVGVFRFAIGREKEGVSNFTVQWIGDHYAILGQKAPDAAKKWWGRLRRFLLKDAVKVDALMRPATSRSPHWATPRAIAARGG